MSFVELYDQQMRLLAVLENAKDVQYQLNHNELSTGSFTLPAKDLKIQHCQAHAFVRITDEPRPPMLYRIIQEPAASLIGGKERMFTLEGAEATMLDKLIFGYHQIGGTGVDTEAVLRWLLDWQDEPKRWVLGRCDFHYEFEYKFESVHLLPALFSVASCIADEYTWIFDTNVTPWTVSLVKASTAPSCGLTYMRNMTDIQKGMDATGLVTRLYPIGYGEGVNELHIGSVNGGLDYIDADTISIWGVKEAAYPDKRIEDAQTLMARGCAVLEELKNPYITYTAAAVDLSRYTGKAWDMFMPGELIRVMDHEHGDILLDMRLKSVQKGDLYGAPHGVTMTIANSERDVTGAINALADRAGIMELYSQGATNMTADQFADNADPDNPFEFPLYLDSDMRRINKVLLLISIEAFRSYEKGAAAGGGTTSTSSEGGGSSVTSGGGGATTVTEESRIVTTEAVTGGTISGHDGDTSGNTGGPINNSGESVSNTGGSGALTTGNSSLLTTDSGGSSVSTGSAGSHNHDVNSHNHSFSGSHSLSWGHTHSTSSTFTPGKNTGGVNSYAAKTISISGTTGNSSPGTDSSGSHSHTMGSHTHGMQHTHSLGSHSHSMGHRHNFSHMHNVTVAITIPAITMTIPSHTHNVTIGAHSHSVTLPNHTHDMIHGIYRGSSASSYTLQVDGNTVPASAIDGGEVDIVPYLSRDEDGRIKRGTWHEITLTPNALTRVVMRRFVKTFIQSVGGGDY